MFKFSVFGAVGVVVSLATLTGPASAQVLDPSTLHVGTGAGTSCSAGGCYVFPTASPNEVNGIGTGAHFDIFQQSNGGVTTTSPTLPIFAVPDGAAAPSLPSTAQLNPPCLREAMSRSPRPWMHTAWVGLGGRPVSSRKASFTQAGRTKILIYIRFSQRSRMMRRR